jgi:CRP/FNR family transcriptional regulator
MIIETLKKSKIFSALPEEDLRKIAPLFEKRDYKHNDYIFLESDPTDWFYIASKGRVKIVKHSLAGKDVILEIKMPGEIFCCSAVLNKRPYPESALAMEDASVIRINRVDLFNLIEKNPLLQFEFAKYNSDRLADAQDMMINIASEKAEKRIATVLLRLAEKAGIEDEGYRKIDLPLTRQEIADMVGTTVETCIRAISKLQKKGMVKTKGRRILVKISDLEKFIAL